MRDTHSTQTIILTRFSETTSFRASQNHICKVQIWINNNLCLCAAVQLTGKTFTNVTWNHNLINIYRNIKHWRNIPHILEFKRMRCLWRLFFVFIFNGFTRVFLFSLGREIQCLGQYCQAGARLCRWVRNKVFKMNFNFNNKGVPAFGAASAAVTATSATPASTTASELF